VQDYCVCEAPGGVDGGVAVRGAVDLAHDFQRAVSDVFWVAVVLVSSGRGLARYLAIEGAEECRGKLYVLDWRDVEDAVAEGAKRDGGVADVGLVGQGHLQDGDVANHGA
jgi:hypothetical protein